MNDRIHQVLDGKLPAQALTGVETARLDATEAAVGRALAALRSEPAPDVTARVMRRIASVPGHRAPQHGARLRRLWKDAWRPRRVTLVVRPPWALACAGIAALLLAGPLRNALPLPQQDSDGLASRRPGSDSAPVVLVQFRLDAPGAREVRLAGDFTNWEPRHALLPTAEGVWTVTVPVAAGVHEYAFIVDGDRWVSDPLAPPVADGFGGENSRLDVLPPARGL